MGFLILIVLVIGVVFFIKKVEEKKESEKRIAEKKREEEEREKKEKERLENLKIAAEAGDVQAKKELGEHNKKEVLKNLRGRMWDKEMMLSIAISEVKRGYLFSQRFVNNGRAALESLQILKQTIEETDSTEFITGNYKWYEKMTEIIKKHEPYYG